jgi:hypothetical protein
MALDDARPSEPRQPRFDDDEYPSIEKPAGGAWTAGAVLAGAGIFLVLVLCVIGVIVGIRLTAGDSIAGKVEGTWKGRWTVHNQPLESVYTFRRDGTFREESFDLQGNRVNVAEARWRVRNGQIEIDWQNGGFEIAVVRILDANTLDYRIVDHNDVTQIGLSTTFKRQ